MKRELIEYEIEISTKISRLVSIKAASEDEAVEKIRKKCANKSIKLSTDKDFSGEYEIIAI